MISAGDTTQNGYKSTEWEACFEVMGDYYAKYPTVTVAGNHEMKGDWNFVSFAQRFNMSGAKTGYPQFDRTMGYFEYGDAIFVILNGEVTPADQKAEIMKKELQWCKSVLDASDKKWRIVMTHAGPYTSRTMIRWTFGITTSTTASIRSTLWALTCSSTAMTISISVLP